MRRNLLLSTGSLLAVVLPLLAGTVSEETLKTRANAKEPTHAVVNIKPSTSVSKQKIVKPAIQKGVAVKKTKPFLLAQTNIIDKNTQVLADAINQDDIRPNHQLIANEVLQVFPAKCQSTLKALYVRYQKPKQRGLASKSTIILDGTVSDDEFRALFIHELGHVMDLGCLVGTKESGNSAFDDHGEIMFNNDPSVSFYSISWTNAKTKKKGAVKEDFVSGYSAYDPFEDLAESVAYYVLHKNMFVKRAETNAAMKLKLQWIETYLFPAPLNVADTQETWTGKVTWDVTLLKYVWNGLF